MSSRYVYPAVFTPEDNGGYSVLFPDLEGCQSFGDTVAEVLDGAKEALEGYCITLLETGHTLPKASDIKAINTDGNTFVTLVEAELTTRFTKQKSVKKTLTIPAWLNDLAVEKGINFSAVLQDGIMAKLNIIG